MDRVLSKNGLARSGKDKIKLSHGYEAKKKSEYKETILKSSKKSLKIDQKVKE